MNGKVGKIRLLTIVWGALVWLYLPLSAQSVLIWSDEFEVDGHPDPTKWQYDEGGHGWGNSELQYYTNGRLANARVEAGLLIIEAHQEYWINTLNFIPGNDYTSARLVSKGHGDWLHGRVEARAKLPAGRGTWPAIWMLPTSNHHVGWPFSGEIDIMEHVGYDMNTVHGSLHYAGRSGANANSGSTVVSDVDTTFHVYAMEWDPDEFRFYVDDQQYHSYTNPNTGVEAWPFTLPFHVILNLAVGGHWGGLQGVDPNIWPQRMEVDYVRVYDLGHTDVLDTDSDMDPNTTDPDDDGDGLSDIDEHLIGSFLHKVDSDDDGYTDGEEVDAGSSPLSARSTPENAGSLISNADFSNGTTDWNITVRRETGPSNAVSFVHSWDDQTLLTSFVSIGGNGEVTLSNYDRVATNDCQTILYQRFSLGYKNDMGLKQGDIVSLRGTASAQVSGENATAEARLQILSSQEVINEELTRYTTIGTEETSFHVQAVLGTGIVDSLLVGLQVHTSGSGSASVTFKDLVATVTPAGHWGLWEVDSGWVIADPWLGPLQVEHAPWIWSEDLDGWLFTHGDSVNQTGGWVYIPK
ncbi:MAG: family 16 glycosylhydrolase [Puniceicoccaceae bacterium]